MIKTELEKRKLPSVLPDGIDFKNDKNTWTVRRAELLETLASQEYGVAPPPPESVTYEIMSYNNNDFGGKAESGCLTLRANTENGMFNFPVTTFTPKTENKHPVIIYISIKKEIFSNYLPVEEIIDRGCGIVHFWIGDVSADRNDDFSSGIASMYSRKKYSWGKISMWAWAASCALDYVYTCMQKADTEKIAVAGHSRCGKTALWAGANDSRFKYVFANNSGCSGDAISRGKVGEHISQITNTFPYWFCSEYKKYSECEDNMPFDQHFLLSALAPRKIFLTAAKEDTWADPYSQFLSAAAASEVYEALGYKGLVCEDRMPVSGDRFDKGSIGFFMRSGGHFLSRTDWNAFIDFFLK